MSSMEKNLLSFISISSELVSHEPFLKATIMPKNLMIFALNESRRIQLQLFATNIIKIGPLIETRDTDCQRLRDIITLGL